MTRRVIIAGAGGQGVMLLGKILAEAVMCEGRFVTWFPAYGAEVRGGTAHSMVVISDEEISSPCVDRADILIALNEPSLDKFKNKLKKSGLLVVNSSLVQRADKAYIGYPFSDIALKLGNIKVANMVALGCCLAHNKIVSLETVLRVIENIAPKDKKALVGINQLALKEGYGLK